MKKAITYQGESIFSDYKEYKKSPHSLKVQANFF
jgi:hypothetical protein